MLTSRCTGTRGLRASVRRLSGGHVISRTSSLTVQIDPWEYCCCRTPPAIDDRVSGQLIAQPGNGIADLRPLGWDANRGLVIVKGGSAYWMRDGESPDDGVTVLLTWQPDDAPGVRASGIVSGLVQTFRHVDDDIAPLRRREVQESETFREPLVGSDGYTLVGLVATLTDLDLVEPTLAEVAAHRATLRRARSTARMSAPATYFGQAIPRPHDRITVDLDDPRVAVTPAEPVHGTITGVVTHVAVATPSRSGAFTMLSSVAADTPADDVLGDLFITVVLDEES
ncbi:hypothetical protein [Williamsia serinedens]